RRQPGGSEGGRSGLLGSMTSHQASSSRGEARRKGSLLSLTSLAVYPQCALSLSNSTFTTPFASKRTCATSWKLILVPSVKVTWTWVVKVDSPFPNASPVSGSNFPFVPNQVTPRPVASGVPSVGSTSTENVLRTVPVMWTVPSAKRLKWITPVSLDVTSTAWLGSQGFTSTNTSG